MAHILCISYSCEAAHDLYYQWSTRNNLFVSVITNQGSCVHSTPKPHLKWGQLNNIRVIKCYCIILLVLSLFGEWCHSLCM